MPDSPDLALTFPDLIEAVTRGFIEFRGSRVIYNVRRKREYAWTDPEEWVRARTLAFLIVSKGYPPNRIDTEVTVPRRTPNDWADIVVYRDERCTDPYLVVENKASGQTRANRTQGVEQLFGNANSLRAPLGLYDEEDQQFFFDVANFPPTERNANLRGARSAVPALYGETPTFTYIAGGATDIAPVSSASLEAKIRRSHSIIWAGGKRDPLQAFDEWSKILFAKVVDERSTPTNEPRHFQVGTHETSTTVANRVHARFAKGCQDDPTIFPVENRIRLTDKKIAEVVAVLQEASLVGTDVDTVGSAFENFFGSIFRGELGQYFTMRQLARFTVSVLELNHDDFVIDPTAGSGGFLLEALLQVWHRIDADFAGQPTEQMARLRNDFALLRVYGIEIHDILSRICKINLLLHHDGHTNIEGDRSCLDSTFTKPRLQNYAGAFTRVVGNPPFGDDVERGDDDILGTNLLENFVVASDRDKVPSEHVVVERCVDFLAPDGRFGLVLPDGFFNNQGEQSNCPRVRCYLAKVGHIEAIVSLPDFAFRKSGAQNKTSILFFRRFSATERLAFDRELESVLDEMRAEFAADARPDVEPMEDIAIGRVYARPPFSHLRVFMAEANHIGYSPAGSLSPQNDLYVGEPGGRISADQRNTILGEWRRFRSAPDKYTASASPDCLALTFADAWTAHSSNRLDPKYHIFKHNEHAYLPTGWTRARVTDLMKRREEIVAPENSPLETFSVMTLGQSGEIRPREPGKGKNPPDWRGMYFADSPSTWYRARAGDLVYSSIDLWKGCIAIVPPEFDNALVTKEFPIFKVLDDRLDAEFLSYLLRTRYYQRAFRAITTGHSNRRRTQMGDFEALEVSFPSDKSEQRRLVSALQTARQGQRTAAMLVRERMLTLSDQVDGRHDGELPAVGDDDIADE